MLTASFRVVSLYDRLLGHILEQVDPKQKTLNELPSLGRVRSRMASACLAVSIRSSGPILPLQSTRNRNSWDGGGAISKFGARLS